MTETAPVTITAFIKKTDAGLPKEELEKLYVKTGIPVPGIEVQVIGEDWKACAARRFDARRDRHSRTVGDGRVLSRTPSAPPRSGATAGSTPATSPRSTRRATSPSPTGSRTSSAAARRWCRRSCWRTSPASADFILEAAVVGVPDDKWGQRPMVIVTLVPGASETEEDVIKHLMTEGVDKGKITKWMLPDYVLITNDIPKTSVGKFNKLVINQNMGDFVAKAKHVRTLSGYGSAMSDSQPSDHRRKRHKHPHRRAGQRAARPAAARLPRALVLVATPASRARRGRLPRRRARCPWLRPHRCARSLSKPTPCAT